MNKNELKAKWAAKRKHVFKLIGDMFKACANANETMDYRELINHCEAVYRASVEEKLAYLEWMDTMVSEPDNEVQE